MRSEFLSGAGRVAHNGGCPLRSDRTMLPVGHDYPSCGRCSAAVALAAKREQEAAARLRACVRTSPRITWIYALRDPQDLQPRYIGSTHDAVARASTHATMPHSAPLRAWVKYLSTRGLAPLFVPLWSVSPGEDITFWERAWFFHFRKLGAPLLNMVSPQPRAKAVRTYMRRSL
jgi:hypothetical protein